MTKSIINVSLYLRTAFFTDSLRATTGLSISKLEKIVKDNQYDAYGLRAPSHDTVKDYFRHKRSPSVDNKDRDTQPWLIACEQEFRRRNRRHFYWQKLVFNICFHYVQASKLTSFDIMTKLN